MTYLNQGLIFGAAAFVIPLIIHILNRSRFKTIDWGAMHLLESVIKINHRRFRIDQLILLLVRCAIPAILALCLARPVLTGAKALEGDTPVSLVLLIDDSYSMESVEGTGTRFDEAVSAANQLIEDAPRGTDFAVIFTGEVPRKLFERPIFDAESVLRKLNSATPGFGASDIAAGINEAIAVAAGMSQSRREIVVLSDFQAADWTESKSLTSDVLQEQLLSQELPPAMAFIPIGQTLTDNISIDSLDFTNQVLGIGQRLDIRANIRNHGLESIDTLRVVMKIDGQEESVSQVMVAEKSTAQVLFPVTFTTPGSHVVEFEVMANDKLKTDNKFAAVFSAWEKLPVLLVDGAPSKEPLQGETDFLSVALTPYTFGRLTLADLIETETITPREITEEKLEEIRVIVLANVDKLKDDQLSLLKTYVESGGALFVTAGNKIDLKWSRDKFFDNGNGLLPSPYLSLNDRSVSDEQPATEAAKIVVQHFEHPALEYFNDSQNGDLSTTNFRRWYSIESFSETSIQTNDLKNPANSIAPVVIARLSSGDPLLVEKKFGDGVVLQLLTTCDADWNDLPLQPVYVPMMQQIITYLASRNHPPQNITTGASAIALLDRDEATDNVSVTTPAGVTQLAETYLEGSLNYAEFNQTLRPGLYRMSLPDDRPLHFMAQVSRNESNPTLMKTEEVQQFAEKSGASLFESSQEYLVQDRLRRNGREIWKYVLAGFLALLFLELVLQQRFARVRV